ncbi:MAG: DUF5320 domain-containing protein [Deltaproteobacteria bacterium]|nr:DUF5320 domain-containing protein [Deltaproteobacteria bacterium]
MPGFDGTGPAGMGSMTGRGMGYCNPSRSNNISGFAGNPAYQMPVYGSGLGRGSGFGRGTRRGLFSGFGRGRGRGYGRGYGRSFGFFPWGRF